MGLQSQRAKLGAIAVPLASREYRLAREAVLPRRHRSTNRASRDRPKGTMGRPRRIVRDCIIMGRDARRSGVRFRTFCPRGAFPLNAISPGTPVARGANIAVALPNPAEPEVEVRSWVCSKN